jgi:hypothetical protein
MQTLQADYFATYRNLKLSRDAKGVLVAEFHRLQLSPSLHLVFRFRRLGPTNIRPSTRRRFVMGLRNNPIWRQGCFKRALTNA